MVKQKELRKYFFDAHPSGFKKTDVFDYYRSLNPEFINASNFPQHFFSIVALFAEDCSYKIDDLLSENGILFISGSNDVGRNELMLKYMSNGDLIVARVQFITRNKGKMTKLFEILKNLREMYGLNRIVIESALTEEMQNWCIKNGFQLVGNDPYTYEIVYRKNKV